MNKVKRLFNPLLIFCGLFITSVQSLSAKEVVPAGLLPEDVTPSHYTLEIKLDPAEKNFSGTTTIDINVSKKTKHFYLHGEDLTVKSTVIKSGKAKIAASTSKTDVTGVLKVSAVKTLKPGKYSITFEYDAPFNENLEGLYRIKDGEKFYAFTQFEAIDARHAFPSFDEPRFKTPFDVTLIIPSNLKAIANTPEKKRTDLKDGWTKIDYATSKPLPTYLVAVAAGDFDIVVWDDIPTTAVRDRVIPLRGVATKGKGGKLKYALENTQAIVESLEDYFQIPYPYEKL
ncbi:MAG: M1 family peptidase, partial [Gammaproteobacteria bacterium]|nr:M1 family peptidase [Gammaproteobacteria bacterium]